jgi:hypothetical protein
MQDHDLDDVIAFTDGEIAAIVAFLHEERETASPLVPDETDTQEEADIDWDAEDDIGRSDPQMIPPLTTFDLEGLFKDTRRSINSGHRPNEEGEAKFVE